MYLFLNMSYSSTIIDAITNNPFFLFKGKAQLKPCVTTTLLRNNCQEKQSTLPTIVAGTSTIDQHVCHLPTNLTLEGKWVGGALKHGKLNVKSHSCNMLVPESASTSHRRHYQEDSFENSHRHINNNLINSALRKKRCMISPSYCKGETLSTSTNVISGVKGTLSVCTFSNPMRNKELLCCNFQSLHPAHEKEETKPKQPTALPFVLSMTHKPQLDLSPKELNILGTSCVTETINKIFKRNAILGEGTYGVVYKAIKRSTGEVVALKKLRWESPNDGIPATSVREVALLRQLNHPNIVKLNSVHYQISASAKQKPRMFLEFEFLELDLRKYMKRFPKRQIPLETIRSIVYQLLQALEYCHIRHIIHRDIKPNNILLSLQRSGKRSAGLSTLQCPSSQRPRYEVDPLSEQQDIECVSQYQNAIRDTEDTQPEHQKDTAERLDGLNFLASHSTSASARGKTPRGSRDGSQFHSHNKSVHVKQSTTKQASPVNGTDYRVYSSSSLLNPFCYKTVHSSTCHSPLSGSDYKDVGDESLQCENPLRSGSNSQQSFLCGNGDRSSLGVNSRKLGSNITTSQRRKDVERGSPWKEDFSDTSREKRCVDCVALLKTELLQSNGDHVNAPSQINLSVANQNGNHQLGIYHVHVKLADFGLARSVPYPLRPMTHEVVTLWYRAPEILLGSEKYTTAIDMWSVGCLFVELLFGRALFAGDVEVDTLFKIFQLLGTPTRSCWEELKALPHYTAVWPSWPRRVDRYDYFRPQLDEDGKDLIDRLLQYDPNRRITAGEALRHPWFEKLHNNRYAINVKIRTKGQSVPCVVPVEINVPLLLEREGC